MENKKGFTLIELIIVIVLLGILSVTALPKFLNVTDNAEEAVFLGIAAAFKSGVKQVHAAWLIRGNNQAVQDFIKVSDPLAGGDLSVNSAGYPADTRGTSLTLNTSDDCLDVWRAVFDSNEAQVSADDTSDFEATYNGNNDCTYIYNKQTSLTVNYYSNTGEVIIND